MRNTYTLRRGLPSLAGRDEVLVPRATATYRDREGFVTRVEQRGKARRASDPTARLAYQMIDHDRRKTQRKR